jgi:hypothetical protein
MWFLLVAVPQKVNPHHGAANVLKKGVNSRLFPGVFKTPGPAVEEEDGNVL